jgi:hypothetical protein
MGEVCLDDGKSGNTRLSIVIRAAEINGKGMTMPKETPALETPALETPALVKKSKLGETTARTGDHLGNVGNYSLAGPRGSRRSRMRTLQLFASREFRRLRASRGKWYG